MKYFRLLLCHIALVMLCMPGQGQVLVPGQTITYSLSLGPVKAGQAKLSTIKTKWKGDDAYILELTAVTSKSVSRIFSMSDTLTSILSHDLKPQFYFKHTHEGDYVSLETASFLDSGILLSKTRKGQTYTKSHTPGGPVYDLVSMVMVARSQDTDKLRMEERIGYKVVDGLEIKQVYLVFHGSRRIKVGDKQTDCQVFSIIEPVTGKNGKKEDTELMKVYITKDPSHLPVGIDFNLKFGTAKARLQ